LPLDGFADHTAPPSPSKRFGWKHVAILFGATVLTIAPWTIACVIRFPREFWFEQAQVFRHLGTKVEKKINQRSAGRFFGRRTFGDRVPFEALLVIAVLGLIVIAYLLWSSQTGSLKVDKKTEERPTSGPLVPKP
jgi:hypothetical protein